MQPTIRTIAGRSFNLLQPHATPFGIEEIAHALSHLCRFTGHTRELYTVAQHSVLVSYVVPDEFAMHGLMHDASEAFMGDVSSPLKAQLRSYKDIERTVEHAIAARFGLPVLRWSSEANAAVKHADRVLLVTEQRDLMPPGDGTERDWPDVAPLPWVIEPLQPFVAKALFLRRFEQLGGVR